MIRSPYLLAIAWFFTLFAATATDVSAQARFTYSADGSEVFDARTGLTWRRCSEGQLWSGGTCTGGGASFNREEALALLKARPGWRLPNVKELASLVDRSRHEPAIDPVAFPNTPSLSYMSATPPVVHSGTYQTVNFSRGIVNGSYQGTDAYYQLRLVR